MNKTCVDVILAYKKMFCVSNPCYPDIIACKFFPPILSQYIVALPVITSSKGRVREFPVVMF